VERTIRNHRLVRRCLKPQHLFTGLATVDIPTDAPATNPKEWKGAWTSLTEPEEIAQAICFANTEQYHQAAKTPLGMEPLASFFGPSAATEEALRFLEGTPLPPPIQQAILPETNALLTTIQQWPQTSSGSLQTNITPDKFATLYKILLEKTSSSPSGRHLGHYKAIANSESLTPIFAKLMSISHKAGFSPDCWQQVVDVMLEKSPGNSKIHRLRIVALQESDFNQSNRLAIGQPLLHHLEDNKILPDMQYGSPPARQCVSAVLTKVLQFEIQRYKKEAIACIENDAVGCYDRIANPIVIMSLRKMDIPESTIISLASTWEHTTHHIKTLYGISDASYRNTIDKFLYGPGQGSTIGPILWLICFLLIYRSLSAGIKGMEFQSVDNKVIVQSKGAAFVDDTGLCATKPKEDSQSTSLPQHIPVINQLQRLAQEWERLLYSTGGALNLSKCFLFVLAWDWKGSTPKLVTSTTAAAELLLTSGASMNPEAIRQIDPTQSFRTLGIHITPSGSPAGALATLREIVEDYSTAISTSKLTRAAALTSYVQHLLPKVRYRLPALTASQQDCERLSTPILMAVLPKLHINRNTSRSIIYGPVTLGGLGFPNVYIYQGIDKLHLLLGHLRLNDMVGQLLHIDLTYVQLLSGSGQLFLKQPRDKYSCLESGWLTSIWDFTFKANLQFHYSRAWIPNLPREKDTFLMELFQSYRLNTQEMRILNKCRIYLQVLTLSDITSADGIYILPEVKAGHPPADRTSNLHWPLQGNPSKSDWTLWASTLANLETKARLIAPLGGWIAPTHQTWHTWVEPLTRQLYKRSQNRFNLYQPINHGGPKVTRNNSTPWYNLTAPTQHLAILPDGLIPATIHGRNFYGDNLVTVVNGCGLKTAPESPEEMSIIKSPY
jgi:hypothetical protein